MTAKPFALPHSSGREQKILVVSFSEQNRRESPWSLVVPNTTFEAAPSSPPRDLTVVPVEDNPSAINLNWQPPKQPNGQITGNDPSSSALTLLVNITGTLMNQSTASSTGTGFSPTFDSPSHKESL
jgi:hypothetical protein